MKAKSLLMAGAFGIRVGGKKGDLEFVFEAEITNSEPINKAGQEM